jgi:Ca2+-binding RTX toxin-like protein
MAIINGTPGDDAGATALVGTNGDDQIFGLAGNDELFGLDGNDTLDGGSGDDTLDGGNGNDTASFASATEGVFAGLGNTGNGSAENASGTEFDFLHSIENLSGSSFNDSLNGNDGDNVLAGGDGHDNLFGRGGNDTMLGGNGDDFLRGSDGADFMDGGSGWDRVSSFVTAPTSGITFDLTHQDGTAQDTGQGMDILLGIEHASGTVLDDHLIGNGGDNWLWDGSDGIAGGGTGNDILSGGGGNDVLETGGGNDVLDGGAGVDTWSFLGGEVEISSAGVTASLALQGAAQNTEQGMMTATGFENLSGSLYDDNLSGDGGDNIILGDLGSDTLSGGAGNDTLYGDGRIQIDSHETGGSGPITTFAQADDVDLDGDGTPEFVSGNDTLDGGVGDDIMNGGGGNDTASFASWSEGVTVGLGTGGNGFATNDAGTENDTLISIENISGSGFNDFINGNNDANVLAGGAGGDALFGRGGDDIMLGGDGNDFLRGSDGADTLDGGAGWDRVSSFVPTPVAGIHFDLNIQGVAQNTGQGMDTLIGIEHASGTTLNDTLTGNGGDNWLWDGSDGVAGGGTGDDIMSGGAGNDLLETGGGNDVLSGGAGTDTLSFLGGHFEISAAGVTYSLALQGAAQATEQGSMTTSGFENVSGSLFDDVLTGDSGANIILGDFGNDVLIGGSGNDTLYGDGRLWVDTADSAGGSGQITLFGEANDDAGDAVGNDTLNGGNGNDGLYGGHGNDTLTGGAGDDRFVIQAASGNDHITDFSNHDTIVFEASSGVDSFSDLTLTKVGSSTVITWGTTDSLTVDGVKPNQMHATDFSFVASAAAAAAADVSREVIGSSLHSASFGGDVFEHAIAAHATPDIM